MIPDNQVLKRCASLAACVQGLEEKRLVIVAGKGGVGKTTTSAAIALQLAKLGRKTLLVTVDPAKRLEDSLGVPVGSDPTSIQPNLWAMMLDPQAVIKEHLAQRIPQAKIQDHPLFRYVTGYLPGLNELMAIGKLNDFRRANSYEVIVVDTAPTGHALSFLGAPKAIKELLGEKSIVKWAVRGYAVFQKLSGAARNMGNLLKRGEDKKAAPPDIDFEKIFEEMEAEANRIQQFLTDPEHSALVLVTIPEKLPVEETCDLFEAVTVDLGMHVHGIVVNKVQPDPMEPHRAAFDALASNGKARKAFSEKASMATGEPQAFIEGLVAAAEFGRIRREMNLEWIRVIAERLPETPLAKMPLFKDDVQGLKRLGEFRVALFG